ncbi:nitrate/nitrite transporter [Streptomyces heilongjiangensis]|uniref:Nitrate/nitrite transporter n=1 Tax=Streptomyces heilongjiangensis TaxID=945052 RepID=A0ABW1BF15_9ACTN|nr:nitrate/nitrite transporter [Streptomyces heilongjiangensis]MDC2950640.1 NarK/NasA family nitrate transporter [Streptomyces heilongjiangensis]
MTAPSTAPAASRGGRWIQHWDPEDETFWNTTGEQVARRNLFFSVLSEHIGFSVWTVWSVMVLFMGPEYGLTPADKFFIVSMATLVGALARIPYTFAVAVFGGRNWTVVSASLLLVPTVAAFAVMEPGTSFTTFLVCAMLAGIGGGNFASSMTNINAFFPLRKKGWALGLNAGGGNIGVPVVQLIGLAVIGAGGGPRVLLGIYIPLIVIAAVLAWLKMDNIASMKNDTGAAREAVKDAHTWIMSFLYIGTFGSFIGYSFAFGLVLQTQFGRTPLQAAYVTFIGPLLGSLIRPVGGALADKYGGARITLWNYVAMAGATGVIVLASMQKSLPLFTTAFIALFVLSGLGNGSTFKMIPGIFQAKALAMGLRGEEAAAYGRRLSGATMGIIGAVGALGGLGINLAFRQSFLTVGSGTGAFVGFLAFYGLCFAVTWAVYLRRTAAKAETATAETGTKPQLSYAEV